MNRRVAISGIGLVTPLGTGKDVFARNLFDGRSGIRPIEAFDTARFSSKLGAEVTGEAALRGGWFHTADLGHRDQEGFVYIDGRKSDLIISSGENIYTAEVERAIEDHPQVLEAVAIGIPDARRGEVVVAFVRLRESCGLEEGGLRTYLPGKIAAFKHPREIHFVADFPRNQAGKVLKAELKKGFEAQRPLGALPRDP